MTEQEVEIIIGKQIIAIRAEINERFLQESGAFMVVVYITNKGHKLNIETPILIFNISGTPDRKSCCTGIAAGVQRNLQETWKGPSADTMSGLPTGNETSFADV